MASNLIPGNSKQHSALSKKGPRTSSHFDKTSSANGLFSRTASADNGSLQRFDLPMYPSPAADSGKLQLCTSQERKFPNAFLPTTAVRYSRKVYIGGLPLDFDKDDIYFLFRHFGRLKLQYWAKIHREFNAPQTRRYAFLDFEEEFSVHKLIRSCCWDGEKPFLMVEYTPRGSHFVSKTIVWISPWRVADSYYYNWNHLHNMDKCRNVVSVRGVPRSLKASELAEKMARRYGCVVYAAIKCDANFKYPTGVAYVIFETIQSYNNAIFSRFMHLRSGRLEKTLKLKPHIVDQICDNCAVNCVTVSIAGQQSTARQTDTHTNQCPNHN